MRQQAIVSHLPKGQSGTVWHNWARTVRATPALLFKPRTAEELQTIVRRARSESRKVRVAGGGHSWTPLVPTEDFLIDTRHLNRVSVDRLGPDGPTVTAQCGVTMARLSAELERHGLAIPSNVVLRNGRVGGVVATASHGTSLEEGTFSDRVLAMTVIDANAQLRTLSNETIGDEAMDAIRCALGTCGIVVDVTLRVQPSFNVRTILRTDLPIDGEMAHLSALISSGSYCDLLHVPFTDKLWCQTSKPTDFTTAGGSWGRAMADVGQLTATLFQRLLLARLPAHPTWTPRTLRFLYRLIGNRDEVEPIHRAVYVPYIELLPTVSMEVAVQMDEGLTNVRRGWQAATELLERYAARQSYPLNLYLGARFIGASRPLLSPARGPGPTCCLELVAYHGTPDWPEFSGELGATWLNLPTARPHWGKEWLQIPDAYKRVRRSYGRDLERFLEIRDELNIDPYDMFLNDFLKRIFSGVSGY